MLFLSKTFHDAVSSVMFLLSKTYSNAISSVMFFLSKMYHNPLTAVMLLLSSARRIIMQSVQSCSCSARGIIIRSLQSSCCSARCIMTQSVQSCSCSAKARHSTLTWVVVVLFVVSEHMPSLIVFLFSIAYYHSHILALMDRLEHTGLCSCSARRQLHTHSGVRCSLQVSGHILSLIVFLFSIAYYHAHPSDVVTLCHHFNK